MNIARFKSRKFWLLIGGLIATIAGGIGYNLDPKWIILLTTAESVLWMVVQGVIDIIGAKTAHERASRLTSRKLWVAIFSVATIAGIGFGNGIDAEFVGKLLAVETGAWFIIQGIIDVMFKKNPNIITELPEG